MRKDQFKQWPQTGRSHEVSKLFRILNTSLVPIQTDRSARGKRKGRKRSKRKLKEERRWWWTDQQNFYMSHGRKPPFGWFCLTSIPSISVETHQSIKRRTGEEKEIGRGERGKRRRRWTDGWTDKVSIWVTGENLPSIGFDKVIEIKIHDILFIYLFWG